MNIHTFLGLPHRFRWGGIAGDDCMTFPASWARETVGIDPAEGLRGTYSTKDDAHRVITEHGGAQAFMDGKLLAIGATRVSEPETGDIGLVVMMAGETAAQVKMTEVGAIRFGKLWASISPGGVIVKQADTAAAWRLPS